MHIRSIGLTLAAFALLLAAACGGDSKGSPLSGGAGNTWDVAKADELTHTALIVAGDLPGSGWSVTDDDFDDDDKGMASGCSDFEGFKKDARAAQVSRAKRQLEKAGSGRNDFGTQVESTVTVFKDAKTASDLANRYKGIVNSDKFVSCFESEIKSDTGSNSKVSIKRGSTNTSAPNGGTSTGLDVDVSVGSDSLSAHTENHVWVSGNAVIQVNVTATKASFNADVIKQAVAKQDQAANDTLKGTRQRSTAATATPARSNPTPTPARPSGTPTPARGATGSLGNLGKLEDTSSHRYVIKIESSGIDFFGMQDLVEGVARESGGPTPRAGTPNAVEITGAYAKPDRMQAKFLVNTTTLTLTTIGTQQWKQTGTKIDGPKTVGRQSVEDLSLAVAMLGSLSKDASLLKVLKCSGVENVNGGPARKCGFGQGELTGTELQEFIDGFLQESDVKVAIRAADVTKASFLLWASQDGDYPVRLLFEFAGKDTKAAAFNLRMEANVTDINKTVDIVAPR
jgi:hypothetical protein